MDHLEIELSPGGIEQLHLLDGQIQQLLLHQFPQGRIIQGQLLFSGLLARSARLNRTTSRLRRSITPRIAHRCRWASSPPKGSARVPIQSRPAGSGSRPTIHFVDEGEDRILRIRQTSNNLRVWGSRPLAASSSITALSAAARVRYVSPEKSQTGVSSRLIVVAS